MISDLHPARGHALGRASGSRGGGWAKQPVPRKFPVCGKTAARSTPISPPGTSSTAAGPARSVSFATSPNGGGCGNRRPERLLLENLPHLILIVDRQGIIQFANHNVTNLAVEQLLGRPAFEFLAPAHRTPAQQALEQAFAEAKVATLEVPDVFGRWWETRIVTIHHDQANSQAMVICSDITPRKKADEAILKERRAAAAIARPPGARPPTGGLRDP